MPPQYHYRPQVNQKGFDAPAAARVIDGPKDSGLAELGDAFRVGQRIVELSAQAYDRYQNDRMDDVVQRVDREMALYKADYMEKNQGVNALQTQKDWLAKHQELTDRALEEYGNPLVNTDNYRHELGKRLAGRQYYAIVDGLKYQQQQKQLYDKSVWDGALSDYKQQIAAYADDPARLDMYESEIVARAARMNPGLDQTAMKAQLQAMRVEGATSSLLAQGRFDDARAALGKTDIPVANGERPGYAFSGFESGGDAMLAIGHDPGGGTSYGKWQLSSTKGSYKEWIDNYLAVAGPEGAAAAKELRDIGGFNTGSRKGAQPEAYKRLAAKYGDLFEQTQYAYIRDTHYGAALNGLNPKLKQMVAEDDSLKEVLFSTAVQHGGGGAKVIFNRAYQEGMSREDFIRKVYGIRGTQFGSQPKNIRDSVQNRFGREVEQAVRMGGGKGQVMFNPNIDPTKAMHLSNQIDAAQRRAESGARAAIQMQLDDYIAKSENGIVMDCPLNPQQIEMAYGERAPEVLMKLNDAREFAVTLSGMKGMSAAEMQGVVAASQPDGNDTDFRYRQARYEKLKAIVGERVKLMTEAPVEYVMQEDEAVQNARTAFLKPEGRTAENFSQYVLAVTTAKLARGMDSAELFTKKDREAFATILNNAEDKWAVGQFWRQSFGEYFDAALQEIMPGCSDRVQIMMSGMSRNAVRALANADSDKHFEDTVFTAKGIEGTDRNRFKQQVNQNLARFTDTLLSGGATEMARELYDVTLKLALSYLNEGYAQGKAIKKAYEDAIGSRYVIAKNVNDSGGRRPYRIPNGQDFRAIQSGAEHFLEKADLSEFRLRSPDGSLDTELTKEAQQAVIRREGIWVTNENESGAILCVGSIPVLGKDGLPVNRTWQELAQYQDEAKGLYDEDGLDPWVNAFN